MHRNTYLLPALSPLQHPIQLLLPVLSSHFQTLLGACAALSRKLHYVSKHSHTIGMYTSPSVQHLKQILGRVCTRSNHNSRLHITFLISFPNTLHFIHFTPINWNPCSPYVTVSKIVPKFLCTCSPLHPELSFPRYPHGSLPYT